MKKSRKKIYVVYAGTCCLHKYTENSEKGRIGTNISLLKRRMVSLFLH